MKEKLGEVFPCCFLGDNDSIKPQEKLDVMLAPFQRYCGLESSEEELQLDTIKKQVEEVLSKDKAKYESMYEDNPRQFRKEWRKRRIAIYDYLLCLALHDPNESQDLWIEARIEVKKCTNHFYAKAALKLKPGRFYTYLVDQVHEDEEIMFKYYCVDKGLEKPFLWRNNAPWLAGSIHIYFKIVIKKALKTLRPWEDGKQPDCDNLVKEAKKKFVDALTKLHGRCFKKERNWRNRARIYYLLGLARHTGISNGEIKKFKNFEYEGPFSHLVREMIVEDEDLFDQEKEDKNLPLICREKYRKQKDGSSLGHLKVNRLLAWASAANDLGFVRVLLKYYRDSLMSRTNFHYLWEKSMGESWAMALWNASYKGHARIVKELLSWGEVSYHLYYTEYFFKKTVKSPHKLLHEPPLQEPSLHGPPLQKTALHELALHEPPLHIAVIKMDVLVVDAFCTTATQHLNCNEKNSHGRTPLEIATKWTDDDEDKTLKGRIQNLLLQRPEVKQAVEEVNNQRQLAVDSSNAVMVGGTLIAGITFAGWLSPPLGYNSYYQLVETAAAAPPNSYESYMSVQGHFTIQLFAIFNSLSFYFAIASVVAGMETVGAIQVVEDTYAIKKVKKLQRKLTWATNLFLASVICVLGAFSCAGIAVLPPIKKYQTIMYFTTAIGGFFCILLIFKMVWYTLPRNFRNKVKSTLCPMFNK